MSKHYKLDAAISVTDSGAQRGLAIRHNINRTVIHLLLHNGGYGRNGNMRAILSPDLAVEIATDLLAHARESRAALATLEAERKAQKLVPPPKVA